MSAELRQGPQGFTPVDVTRDVWEMFQHLRKTVERGLVGSFVRVTSDHNGQAYGRSRSSWRGQVARIKAVHIDLYNGMSLQLEGRECECFIPADEVEFAS